MTLVWRSTNSSSIHRHAENPIGIGPSAADDTNDGDDDELQGFSNGVEHSAVRSRNGGMNRHHGEHKRDEARRCSRPTEPLGTSIAQHTSSYSRRLMTEIDDPAPHTTPLPHSSNEHYSPTGSVRDADRMEETVDVKAGGRSKSRDDNPQ
jgi:hypothetical protein